MIASDYTRGDPMAILYVASEASELKPFAAYLTGLRKLNWPLDYAFEGVLEGKRVMLAANGAGPRLSAQAVEVAQRAVLVAELSSSRLEAVVSVGYCGALDPSLSEGEIVVAEAVLDAATGVTEGCSLPHFEVRARTGLVVSQDKVVNKASEKLQLRSSGAIAVEMEAAGVFARCRKAELPFFCIKAVTDLAGESFPVDFNAMRTTEGRLSRGKIGSYVITHPAALPGLLRLRSRAENAAKALGEFLVSCRIQVESGISAPE
jgi:adenosylhomocysteine nucleosidase